MLGFLWTSEQFIFNLVRRNFMKKSLVRTVISFVKDKAGFSLGAAHVNDRVHFPLCPGLWHYYSQLDGKWVDGFTHHWVILTLIVTVVGHQCLGLLGQSSLFASWRRGDLDSLVGEFSSFPHPAQWLPWLDWPGDLQLWCQGGSQAFCHLVAWVVVTAALSWLCEGPSRWFLKASGAESSAKWVSLGLALELRLGCRLKG